MVEFLGFVVLFMAAIIAALLYEAKQHRGHLKESHRMIDLWRGEAVRKEKAGRQIWLELLDARRRLHEVTHGERTDS